jgi:hypothetical protein
MPYLRKEIGLFFEQSVQVGNYYEYGSVRVLQKKKNPSEMWRFLENVSFLLESHRAGQFFLQKWE